MEAKQFGSADARKIIERIVATVPAGREREALLILAGETLREASAWLETASKPRTVVAPLSASAPSPLVTAAAKRTRRA